MSGQRVAYVITGVSGALGGGIARRLIGEGQKVIGLDVAPPEEEILGMEFVRLDLADRMSVDGAATETLQRVGEDILALVNVAGVYEGEMSYEETERVFKVNAGGTIYWTDLLLDKIRKCEGLIVNVTSTAAHVGKPKTPIYAPSKWALRGYTKCLQEQLKEEKTRVVEFAIGRFRSGLRERVTGQPDTETGMGLMPAEDAVWLLRMVLAVPKSIQVNEIIGDSNNNA